MVFKSSPWSNLSMWGLIWKSASRQIETIFSFINLSLSHYSFEIIISKTLIIGSKIRWFWLCIIKVPASFYQIFKCDVLWPGILLNLVIFENKICLKTAAAEHDSVCSIWRLSIVKAQKAKCRNWKTFLCYKGIRRIQPRWWNYNF